MGSVKPSWVEHILSRLHSLNNNNNNSSSTTYVRTINDNRPVQICLMNECTSYIVDRIQIRFRKHTKTKRINHESLQFEIQTRRTNSLPHWWYVHGKCGLEDWKNGLKRSLPASIFAQRCFGGNPCRKMIKRSHFVILCLLLTNKYVAKCFARLLNQTLFANTKFDRFVLKRRFCLVIVSELQQTRSELPS